MFRQIGYSGAPHKVILTPVNHYFSYHLYAPNSLTLLAEFGSWHIAYSQKNLSETIKLNILSKHLA